MEEEIKEQDVVSFYVRGGFRSTGRVISVEEHLYCIVVGSIGTYFVPKGEQIKKIASPAKEKV